MTWVYLSRVTGTTAISIPSDAKELDITAYRETGTVLYKNRIFTEQLGTAYETLYLSGYFYSTSDYGYGSVYVRKTDVKLRAFRYGAADYTSSAELIVRYRK